MLSLVATLPDCGRYRIVGITGLWALYIIRLHVLLFRSSISEQAGHSDGITRAILHESVILSQKMISENDSEHDVRN